MRLGFNGNIRFDHVNHINVQVYLDVQCVHMTEVKADSNDVCVPFFFSSRQIEMFAKPNTVVKSTGGIDY